MRLSNTGERNVTYDVIRDRYRVEMRVGKVSRTARCKTLPAALEIRNAWLVEREEAVNDKNGEKLTFSIEKRPVEVSFD